MAAGESEASTPPAPSNLLSESVEYDFGERIGRRVRWQQQRKQDQQQPRKRGSGVRKVPLESFSRLASRTLEEKKLEALRERKRLEEEEDVARSCTFHPAISETSSRLAREARWDGVSDRDFDYIPPPLHQRLAENKRRPRRTEEEEEQQLTFRPKINDYRPACPASPPRRLPSPAPKSRQQEEEEELRPTPQINPNSRRMAEVRNKGSEFLQRQLERMREARETQAWEASPHPVLRTQCEIDTALHRMHARTRQGQERVARMREAAVEGLFRPAINGSRRRCSSAAPANPPRSKDDDVQRLREELLQKERREAPHAPRIDQRSRELAERGSRGVREGRASLYGRSLEAQERVRRQRREKMLREEEECTFSPCTSAAQQSFAALDVTADAAIPGFQQFLCRQEHARRKELEKRVREESLSRPSPSAMSGVKRTFIDGRIVTIPEPFVLSTGIGKSRRRCSGDHSLFEEGEEAALLAGIRRFDDEHRYPHDVMDTVTLNDLSGSDTPIDCSDITFQQALDQSS